MRAPSACYKHLELLGGADSVICTLKSSASRSRPYIEHGQRTRQPNVKICISRLILTLQNTLSLTHPIAIPFPVPSYYLSAMKKDSVQEHFDSSHNPNTKDKCSESQCSLQRQTRAATATAKTLYAQEDLHTVRLQHLCMLAVPFTVLPPSLGSSFVLLAFRSHPIRDREMMNMLREWGIVRSVKEPFER